MWVDIKQAQEIDQEEIEKKASKFKRAQNSNIPRMTGCENGIHFEIRFSSSKSNSSSRN